jgi:hypothetical protein
VFNVTVTTCGVDAVTVPEVGDMLAIHGTADAAEAVKVTLPPPGFSTSKFCCSVAPECASPVKLSTPEGRFGCPPGTTVSAAGAVEPVTTIENPHGMLRVPLWSKKVMPNTNGLPVSPVDVPAMVTTPLVSTLIVIPGGNVPVSKKAE